VVSLPEWSREKPLFGIGMDERRVPAAASDFVLEHDVRGRCFNPFYFGGYLLWRFWPERERLPFMDIHQSGTREERERYVRLYAHPDGWRELDERYRFDWVVLDAAQHAMAWDATRDRLDEDPRFALVFRDDAAALYVRREGRHAELAGRFGYHLVPGGEALLPAFGRAVQADSAFRAGARAELERRIGSSPWNAEARSLLANLDFIDHDLEAARVQLEAALRVDPRLAGAHERLALIAMQQGRAEDAVRELEAELELGPGSPLLARRLAEAYQRTGQRDKAREWYGKAGLTSPPPGGAAGDSAPR
jgi:tetratricopeptide (TPR) repeat protein